MAPLSHLAFASTLLVSSVASVAGECPANVTQLVVATINNSTFYNTCAKKDEDITFNVTNLFDVLNFTSAQFHEFCDSELCLNPVHEMVHSIPSDCLIQFMGSERNISKEVKELHDKCHQVLGVEDTDDDTTDSDDKHGGANQHMGMNGQNSNSNSSSTPKTSASAPVSTCSFVAAAIAGFASVAALL